MRAVKSVSIDSERRVIITFLDGSTETLYPNCIWCDAEALKEIIKELLEEKADAVVQTINDVAIATFADGADEALIRKLLVSIEPIQGGTGDPSPENVRPISGRTGLSVWRTGKNLFYSDVSKNATLNGVTAVFDVNTQAISISGTNTSQNNYIVLSIDLFGLPLNTPLCKPEGLDAVYYNLVYYDGSWHQVNNGQTIPDSATRTSLQIGVYGTATTLNRTLYPQIEVGSTPTTDYEPYKGSTYSVNWETEAGTVYGGTLDVVSGKLIVNRAKETRTWGSVGNATALTNVTRKRWNFERDSKYITSDAKYDLLCNCIGVYSVAYSLDDIHMYIAAQNYAYIYLPTSTDDSTVIELSYTLAEPIEYQLTPQEITTLLGDNNIWADSGNILELEYVADTKLYIGESQSGTLGSGRQTITNPEIQPVSEKTVEDLSEAVKADTEVERGE